LALFLSSKTAITVIETAICLAMHPSVPYLINV
jgi:hypothetical protein